MPPGKNVHDTRISTHIRKLHLALISIVSAMNRPELDERMVREAGISLDRAFPLLVLVERLGPIGVVDLAGRVGRDYTTVSHQVAKLARATAWSSGGPGVKTGVFGKLLLRPKARR